jgi:solute carrier family 35 protein E1
MHLPAHHLTNGITRELSPRRRSSSIASRPNPNGNFKFPEYRASLDQFIPESVVDDTPPYSREGSPKPLPNGIQHLHSAQRTNRTREWAPINRNGRQKSLSEAIGTIRSARAHGRKQSISQGAQEIAESLKAPVSYSLIALCAFWYATSILTNTSSKAILTALPKPVTLTIIQFLLVSAWCLGLSALARKWKALGRSVPVLRNGIRKPSRELIIATLPLTAFQIGGHILSSSSMGRIPVSLVHTIKGLSPLMTVLAYRMFYGINYSTPTYLSLIPLTLGVILACAADTTSNFLGLLYAFGSAVLFVTQNIVSKKLFNESARAEQDGQPLARRKPDKLNLLCYSSALAFLFTAPIWLLSEGRVLAADFFHDASITLNTPKPTSTTPALDHGALVLEFLFNGTFHFLQSLVAFVLLGMVSPVTYSVASLIKRVAVILFAVLWWGKAVSGVQGIGFGLTFVGLYLYDRTHGADKRAEKRAEAMVMGHDTGLLPLNTADTKRSDSSSMGGAGPGNWVQSPADMQPPVPQFGAPVYNVPSHLSGFPRHGPADTGSTYDPPRPRSNPGPSKEAQAIAGAQQNPLPGTKAEETWTLKEQGIGVI